MGSEGHLGTGLEVDSEGQSEGHSRSILAHSGTLSGPFLGNLM